MKLKLFLFFCVLAIAPPLQSQTVDFSFNTVNGFYCNPQTVTFTQNCSGSPVGFIWDFGNGQSGSNAVETVIYTAPGTYSVTLTALYATNAISSTKTITINPTPTIALGANSNYLCQPGVINFTATGSAFITSYEWDFGDGTAKQITNANTISHNYTGYGSYTASVKGITSFSCSATSTYMVQVSKFGINGSINPGSGCIPVNATLSVNTNLPAGDADQSFVWDFGDGSPTVMGAGNSINHLYNITTPITTASVFITSVQGCTNKFSFSQVAYGTPPFNTLASTLNNRDTFCASETITFFGKAINANSYLWDFGDGTSITVTDTVVTHKYATLANKKVIVTPFFNGCAGTKRIIDIFIEGVIAGFTYNNLCSNKNVYTFRDTSLGNVTHFEWIFSDNPILKDSVNFNVTHTFPPTGSYTATLFVLDRKTGCSDIISSNIYTARPNFSSNKNSVCKDSLITYRVSNSYPASGGFTYEFHVNGNTINNGADSVLNYYPANHGNFTDYVVIQDNVPGTCNDTLYLAGATKVKGPVTGFTAPARLCADKKVTFTNTSYPFFANENIVTWKWDFGDNKKDSVQNPAPHFYTSAGGYNITLTATDINGCALKAQQLVNIDPLPRIRVFPRVDTICQSRDTAILRAYTVDTLLWIPATFISCNNCDTIKAYPPVTTFYIAQVTNTFGCRSYDTALVKVYAPFALQVFPKDTTVCPGKPVPFNLNITGITSWSPSTYLNDATIKNPISIPDTAIIYTIIVKDSVGCYADTATADIHVYPIPTVNAGPDKVLPYNTPFTISPAYSADVVSYLWIPQGSLNCTTCPAPNGIALKSEIYRIEVTNNNGCKAKDDITVFVACEKSNLLIPTAFTPDKNGLNDYFYPITRGYRIIKAFLVYNRFGNKVFERKNFSPNIPSLGWDGNIKGDKGYGSPSQAFVWYVVAECDQGQTITAKGSVILIR